MKLKAIIFVAVCAIGLFVTGGCGASKKDQSLTLTPKGAGGFDNLQGEGATLQLIVTVNDSNGMGYDVTRRSTFTVTPIGTDYMGAALAAPPQTVEINATGMLTAVEPFDCSWHDLNYPADQDPASGLKPAWFVSGSYTVTATYNGLTSNPVYVAVASAAGDGPSGQCGP